MVCVCMCVCVCVCVSCVYVCVLACVMQTSKVVRNFINSQSLTRGASMTVSHRLCMLENIECDFSL